MSMKRAKRLGGHRACLGDIVQNIAKGPVCICHLEWAGRIYGGLTRDWVAKRGGLVT